MNEEIDYCGDEETIQEILQDAVSWNEAKTKVHDASGITEPEQWLWVKTNEIYYPYERIS